MRILGLTVGRNEAGRYLQPMLEHHSQFLDDHFFYDDQSTDDTPLMAGECGAIVKRRSDDVPSFVENEGMFREAAWQEFEASLHPKHGNLVLVIDCDEVLIPHPSSYPGATIRGLLEATAGLFFHGYVAADLNIPEVFGFNDDGVPLIRKDALWGTIHAPRLFFYQSGASYYHGQFGTPAVPSYVMQNQSWYSQDALVLMHYGYAREKDRSVKYDRYAGHSGHSNNHVNSILSDQMELVPWIGPYVEGMR